MAETNTTQGAKIIAQTKLLPHESFGRERRLCAKMPTTYAQLAINDTVFFGRIPAGSRILAGSKLSCAAGTASSTMDIGLRSTRTQTLLNTGQGLAIALDIAAAGVKDINTGTYIAAGAEFVTTEECDVVGTVKGAVMAANQALKVEIAYVND